MILLGITQCICPAHERLRRSMVKRPSSAIYISSFLVARACRSSWILSCRKGQEPKHNASCFSLDKGFGGGPYKPADAAANYYTRELLRFKLLPDADLVALRRGAPCRHLELDVDVDVELGLSCAVTQRTCRMPDPFGLLSCSESRVSND